MTDLKRTRRQYPTVCCPGKPHVARGLCAACYQYYSAHGTEDARGKRLTEIVAGHERRKAEVASLWKLEDKKKERSKGYAAKRDRTLRWRYGITHAEYLQKMNEQGGVCAICAAGPKRPGVLCIDHDHATGKVRKLLCEDCNNIVGVLETRRDKLHRAEEYLLYFKSNQEVL